MYNFKNLRELREIFNLTQLELAEESGITQAEVSNLEMGKINNPRLGTLLGISKTFNMNIECLLDNVQED